MSPKKKKMANYLDLSNKSSVAGQGRLPKFRGQIDPVVTIVANKKLYDYESGTVYLLDGTGVEDAVLTVTLPSAKAGLNFKFILSALGNESAEDIHIKQAAADEDFVGHIITGAGTKDTATSSDTKIIFDQSGGASAGDYVTLYCDGTSWFVQGVCGSGSDVIFG
jgi:hypothetical protein